MISRRNFFMNAGAVALSAAAVSRVGAASLPEAASMAGADTEAPPPYELVL